MTGARPLIVSDCDEVLLHMVSHFRDWLAERHDIEFRMDTASFADALRHRGTGAAVAGDEIWRLLGLFFDHEMHRQHPVAGAVAAMNTLSRHADVVILTNLVDARREHRAQQLAAHGIRARVFTNQGPKGPALAGIIAEYRPSFTIFIDDLAQHHRSVKELLPEVTTLHLCAEALVAPHIPCAHRAGHADARIDTWDEALPWLLERLGVATPAPHKETT
ncbi:HAD family hydrolase [Erythrobacteraceae bacterium CFH 75059]|uniref:HAD family hydrolase n=1 Tax=Qipengyuania thermophila TaxID=2509361 RepID=UPI0010216AFB|nr:HAD family hydrolase [Qipengyuania thermophila]TCD06862.1 HAD family hydrolase [Erythrobacteraceae bacterium CFH 75059]